MFSLINAARLYKINPDNALELTNQKFIRRFNYLEEHTIKEGKTLKTCHWKKWMQSGTKQKERIMINNVPIEQCANMPMKECFK